MKILLLGGHGQLGWELRRSLAVLGEIVAPLRGGDGPNGLCGDLADHDGLALAVRRLQPELIVNAAAYTAVDQAESDRKAAQEVNAAAVALLAQEAASCGAWLVHYSSDYVFNGSGNKPWSEQDEPAPLNWYGATKLEGERFVLRHHKRHLILRTSWVYASRGGNFARTMLRLAGERDELNVVDDQVGAPTGADLIADVTAHIVGRLVVQPHLAGLYHLSAQGETSWLGYARHVLAFAERAGLPLRVNAGMARAVRSSVFPGAAQRPLNSRLDTSLLRKTFGLHLPDWQVGVDRMLAEILAPSVRDGKAAMA